MTARRPLALFVASVIVASVTMLLAPASPAAADHIVGEMTLCGQVLDYVAPIAATDGTLSISGVTDPDPHPFVVGAGASLSPADSALLTTIAATDSFTCLTTTGDATGVLTALAIATGIPSLGTVICGQVTRDASDAFVVAGTLDTRTTLTAEAAALIAATQGLDELFAAFADFGGEACVAFTLGVDGIVESLRLSGGATVCGQLEDTSADSRTFIFEPAGPTWAPAATITLEGITIASSTFPRGPLAALEFASNSQATGPIDACFGLDITPAGIVPALSRVEDVDTVFCGDSTEPAGDALWLVSVDPAPSRVLLLPELVAGGAADPGLDANLEEAIRMAMGGATAGFQPPGGCLALTYDHDGAAYSTTAHLNGEVIVDVISRSATQIVVRRVSDGAEFTFTTTFGSGVPACMEPGYRFAGTVDAFLGGEIAFAPFASGACVAPGAGGLPPDTSAVAGQTTAPLTLVVGLALLGLGVALAGRRFLTRRP